MLISHIFTNIECLELILVVFKRLLLLCIYGTTTLILCTSVHGICKIYFGINIGF